MVVAEKKKSVMSLQYRMMNTFLGKILEEQEGFGDKLSSFDTKTRMRLLYITDAKKPPRYNFLASHCLDDHFDITGDGQGQMPSIYS